MNRKIILSTISIVSTLAMIAGATFAYFSSTQTVSANTISTGSMNFTGIIEDKTGSSANNSGKFTDTLAPGQSTVRCLWVTNTGDTSGRFKIYASAESGDVNVGNGLTISAVLNPTSGDCFGLTNPTTGTVVYGPNNLVLPALQNVAVRGSFLAATTTPFKIDSASDPMSGGQYALYRVTITLDPSNTTQGSSYTNDVTILGEQNEGSLGGSGW